MAKTKKFIIPAETQAERLDVFLAEKLGVSRSQVQKMIREQRVVVNGKQPKKSGDTLRAGHEIVITAPVAMKKNKKTAKPVIAVKIVADTPDYAVVHKPAGLLVHQTEAHESGTMAEQLLKLYPKIKNVGDAESRAGIVHRLDREASGLLVVPKTSAMFDTLKKQFQDRTVEKEYTVLVHGVVETNHGEIDFALDRGHEGRMASRPKVDLLTLHGVRHEQPGKESLTEFWVEKRFVRYTLLRVKIHTGRMHQIRAHMLAYGHPVVGDMLYFNKKLNRKRDVVLGRLFLHSTKLCFVDLSGEKVCFEDPLPKELRDFLVDLR